MLSDIFPIAGKTVLLTGATGYLGRAITQMLCVCGADLVILVRDKTRGEALLAEMDRVGGFVISMHVVDAYDIASFDRELRRIVHSEEVDVLINNAYDMSPSTGFNTPPNGHIGRGREVWLNAFDCMYWSAITTQQIGANMANHGGGNIINIGSMYSVQAPDPKLYEGVDFFNPVTYTTMKHAVLGLTRYTASFLGEHGVVCNALCPGAFPDPEKVEDDLFTTELCDKTALRRIGVPSDLMGPLLMLATTKYMTGQAVIVDGGWTIC